jgi:hypothetical protein
MRSRRLPYRRQLPRQPTNPRASSIESAHRRPQNKNIAIEAAVLFVDRIREPFLRRGTAASSFDSVLAGAQGAEIRRRRCLCIDLDGKWNILKQCDGTKACDESPITVACYLCNTLPKTA